MSAAEEPRPSEVPKRGLSKYVSRMKTVIKRSDGSNRLSFVGKSPSTATDTRTPQQQTTASAPSADAPEPVENAPLAEAKAVAPHPHDVPGVTKVMRSQIEAERAQKLGERFKIAIDLNEWTTPQSPDKEAYRVEKEIRMRVHRICHRCNATFGGTKLCSQCQHTRCTKCPRYPIKKEGKSATNRLSAPVGAQYIAPELEYALSEQIVLTIPSKTGGKPLVRKKPMQRVRRTCHECSQLFGSDGKICSGCGHIRCTDCPRDPPKKHRFPDGYPGDVHSATSTAPIKHECHRCAKIFPPSPHPASEEGVAQAEAIARGESFEPPKCVRCGHPKCSSCLRAKPMKVEPKADPAVLKSLTEKLAALKVLAVET